MKLDQLIMFKEVAELGSLRQASDKLHKTQPAISQGIRQLESDLEIKLFNRSNYRLALTDAGKMLYQHALLLVEESVALRQVASHIAKGNETSITISIEASFDLKVILPLLESVQNQFSDTQIVLRQEYLSGAVEALKSQNATLCISPWDDVFLPSDNLESRILIQGSMINVASKKLLARHSKLSVSRDLLKEYQIVVQDSGIGTRNREWRVQDGQRRWYVNDFLTKRMLIESGMGWGSLPSQFAQPGIDNGSLVILKLNDIKSEVHTNYHIIKNKTQILGPVANALWEQFKAYKFTANQKSA